MKRKIKQWYYRNCNRPDFQERVQELKEMIGVEEDSLRSVYDKIDELSLSESLKAFKITTKK